MSAHTMLFAGTFLVAYVIAFSLIIIPTFIMEVTIGQYIQRGAMEVWVICPLFKGVGIGNVVLSFMCCSYYCVIVAWAIYYMISSFAATFPWENCDNWWNTIQCITTKQNSNLTIVQELNSNLSGVGLQTETSVQQFWERRVLKQSDTFFEFGGLQLELLGLLFLAWFIVYIALRKGITKARKFVYFCAFSPYVLLIVLLIRALTLPGAGKGLSYYFTPNFTKLVETTVWRDAGTQVLYSYGVGYGTLTALGSHNSFNQNCFRDSFITCAINGGTSILAGVGLVFQAYPEVASNLPVKQVWAVLFFFMIVILGLDTQVCILEGFFTALEDTFPAIRRFKSVSLAITCFIFFIIGIPMVSQAGSYWLTLFDAYGASGIALLFVVFFEVIGLAWGFGAKNIRNALKEMISLNMSIVWDIFWKFLTPISVAVLFIVCIVKYEPLRYPTGENFPSSAEIIGFILALCSMIVVPAFMVYYLLFRDKKGTLKERVIRGFKAPPHLRTGRPTTTRVADIGMEPKFGVISAFGSTNDLKHQEKFPAIAINERDIGVHA
ncbi:unnamed protein product [Dracunculus medinensis]|uniref:Sodium-and chloride-dependent GABA transporter 1 n=1 Tax=Dracunculus medinensis TaxID=318479 RepID=A0A0N4UIQ5_DRAME|nr:unnamed protein product [Dracunculus medinensis]